jgi:HD-like signal output (HDOD) protein
MQHSEATKMVGKRRILFVDDEQQVLDGLRNLLRKQRNQWDMLFALGGEAALAEMEREPVDVIVSDMRMPRIDGAELLRRVKDIYPQTARIVLSGHAEREAIARVVSFAHQFLSKPSDANTVKAVIERTCDFLALMQDQSIRRVVGAIERLPSLPDTYWELTRATENPETGVGDVAKIIERDPAMSVKVLQLVNSAYFGLPQRTDSITGAVSYLGIDNIKALLVAAHVFGADENQPIPGFSIDKFREESVMTAGLARRMVRDAKNRDSAFTAGLVHDVGKLVLARDRSRPYGDILAKASKTKPLHTVEFEDIGTTHGVVGGYLLGVWGLPFVIAETVAHHHTPSAIVEGNVDVLGAVHLASTLVESSVDGTDPMANLDKAFLERAGLVNDIGKWRDEIATTGPARR